MHTHIVKLWGRFEIRTVQLQYIANDSDNILVWSSYIFKLRGHFGVCSATMQSFTPLCILFVYLVTWTAAQSDQACYWPDGSLADSGQLWPCPNSRDTGGQASCCWVSPLPILHASVLPVLYELTSFKNGDWCAPNGFCLGSGNAAPYRGGCTDRNWGSLACPQDAAKCTDKGSHHYYIPPRMDTNIYVFQASAWSIPIVQCSDNTFICGFAFRDCENKSTTFRVAQAQRMVFQLLPDEHGLCNFTTNSASNLIPIATLATSSSSSSPSVSPSIDNTSISSAAVNPTSYCSSTNDYDVALGVGLGVPLGVALFACGMLSVLLLRRGIRTPSKVATYSHRYGHPDQQSPEEFTGHSELAMPSPGFYRRGLE